MFVRPVSGQGWGQVDNSLATNARAQAAGAGARRALPPPFVRGLLPLIAVTSSTRSPSDALIGTSSGLPRPSIDAGTFMSTMRLPGPISGFSPPCNTLIVCLATP